MTVSCVPGAHQRTFSVGVGTRMVPGVLWTPEQPPGPAPLVLVSHGGSGHKLSPLVLAVAQPLIERHNIAVAAIDGPVHGSRRAVFASGAGVRQEFRELWAHGDSVDPMVADWRAALDSLGTDASIDARRVAWYGVSMGTAYGVPLVAAEPRIRGAVLGMWGSCRAPSERLLQDAARVRVPVLFQRQSEDPFFTIAGQEQLYAELASPAKRMSLHPGAHDDPAGAQLEEAVEFLAGVLLN